MEISNLASRTRFSARAKTQCQPTQTTSSITAYYNLVYKNSCGLEAERRIIWQGEKPQVRRGLSLCPVSSLLSALFTQVRGREILRSSLPGIATRHTNI